MDSGVDHSRSLRLPANCLAYVGRAARSLELAAGSGMWAITVDGRERGERAVVRTRLGSFCELLEAIPWRPARLLAG